MEIALWPSVFPQVLELVGLAGSEHRRARRS